MHMKLKHKIWRVVSQERAYCTASLWNAGLGNIWLYLWKYFNKFPEIL